MNQIFGILGLNQRNIDLIQEYNPRKYFPLVDDKVKTKALLKQQGIPVAETIGIVSSFIEIGQAIKKLKEERSAVIKPSLGRAGGGILLLESVDESCWKTPTGNLFTETDLKRHMGDILFGVYSFGRADDSALIEQKIIPHQFLKAIYEKGIADIRLILFKNRPVMAMLRVPTDKSEGKANLHQGAMGIKVDMEKGLISGGFWKNRHIIHHPDSNASVSGQKIPFWPEIVDYSIKASKVVPLDYVGIDLVIDKIHGPIVLEINARPGLQIQVVNQTGLKPILKIKEGKKG